MMKMKTIKGIGASNGIVIGSAHFINRIHDISVTQSEHIIISRDATPFVLPALLMAKGVIAMRGGITSHLAILARQYAKPCVVGIQDIAVHVKEGDWLKIDGATGMIFLLE